MSLILDALQKSDRHNARQATERLREGPAPARPPGRFGWLVALLATALAAAVVGAAAIVLVLEANHGAVGENPRIMENNSLEPRAAPVRDLGAELAPPKAETETEPSGETAKGQPKTTLAPLPAAGSLEEIGAVPIGALTPAERAQLPNLHVDVHAWAEDPDSRFVLINLRRYAEGDRLEEGPRVRQIRRDEVVLEYNGIVFALPRH